MSDDDDKDFDLSRRIIGTDALTTPDREAFRQQRLHDLFQAGRVSWSFDGQEITYHGTAAAEVAEHHRRASLPKPRRPDQDMVAATKRARERIFGLIED